MGASVDPRTERLIERSIPLKDELFAFGTQRRYAADLDDARDDRLSTKPNPHQGDLINAHDYFFLQHRLPNGRTLIDHYVEEHPGLPEPERAMLLGWRDVVEGVFAVTRRDGNALILDNLVDELSYRTHSNKGEEALKQIPIGSFIIARVIPIDDIWILSGSLEILPRSSRLHLYHAAAEIAMRFPRLAFRNPEKLAQAWKIQRDHLAAFVALFGCDTVVVPGHELPGMMRRLRLFQTFEWRDETGETVAERTEAATGKPLDPDDFDDSAFDSLTDAETIGVIYDEIDGMTFFREYGLLDETFARPELLSDKAHKEVVTEYLEAEDGSPVPFRRLAAAHPGTVDQLFRRLLGPGEFSWERDGEELMQTYKPDYYAQEHFPNVSSLSPTMAKALRRTRPPSAMLAATIPVPAAAARSTSAAAAPRRSTTSMRHRAGIGRLRTVCPPFRAGTPSNGPSLAHDRRCPKAT